MIWPKAYYTSTLNYNLLKYGTVCWKSGNAVWILIDVTIDKYCYANATKCLKIETYTYRKSTWPINQATNLTIPTLLTGEIARIFTALPVNFDIARIAEWLSWFSWGFRNIYQWLQWVGGAPFALTWFWDWPAEILFLFQVFDSGLLTISQYILLDPILLFFVSAAIYFKSKCSIKMCSDMMYTKTIPKDWLTINFCTDMLLCGVCLGCTVAVKWTGLYTVAFIALWTLQDIWSLRLNKVWW